MAPACISFLWMKTKGHVARQWLSHVSETLSTARINDIWACPIFKWIVVTWLKDRALGLKSQQWLPGWYVLAPILLTTFRSNSKFDQNLQCSGLKYTLLITMKLSTHQDSYTVTCTKFRCDQLNIFLTRALQLFIEFRIRSRYHEWDGRLLIFFFLWYSSSRFLFFFFAAYFRMELWKINIFR